MGLPYAYAGAYRYFRSSDRPCKLQLCKLQRIIYNVVWFLTVSVVCSDSVDWGARPVQAICPVRKSVPRALPVSPPVAVRSASAKAKARARLTLQTALTRRLSIMGASMAV